MIDRAPHFIPQVGANPDTILPFVSLFSLRSNNSTTETLQLQTQQSNRKHSGDLTILLPLLQVLNSLEVLVY